MPPETRPSAKEAGRHRVGVWEQGSIRIGSHTERDGRTLASSYAV